MKGPARPWIENKARPGKLGLVSFMQQVPLTSPLKGVVRAVNREGQPPETCWDALNCLPYDRYGRKRLSQRTGLAKQYPTPMGDGSQFVQGMIEAPNIIYPPGSVTVPLGSVNDLQNPFTFSAPGTVGPLPYTGPRVAFNLQWEWSFEINYSITTVPADPSQPWFADTESATAIFFFPLDGTDGSANSLILILGCTATLASDSSGYPGGDLGAAIWYGVPNNGYGPTWTQLGVTNTPFPFSAGQTSGSASRACTLTISTTGVVTLTFEGGSDIHTSIGGFLEAPELNCLSVEIDPFFGGNNIASTSQTFSVTD